MNDFDPVKDAIEQMAKYREWRRKRTIETIVIWVAAILATAYVVGLCLIFGG